MTCGGGSGGGGGGGGRLGEEGASCRKGWDLPARRTVACPRLILGSLLRGLPARTELPGPPLLPPLGAHHSYPGARAECGRTNRFFLCECVCLALLTQQKKDGIWDPLPAGYLFLTCCNLPAGSFLSVHLGFLHIAAKIHFHAPWLNVVLHRSAFSRGFLSS